MTTRARKNLRRLTRSLGHMALATAAIAALLELVRMIFRNNQLFCPERQPISSWDPADYGLDPSLVDDIAFESDDGTVLHAWYCRTTQPISSVLYCHGNSGNLTHSAASIPLLNRAGLNVFMFDYRGFGRSTGFATLAGVIQDAEAAAREHHALRPHNIPSILYGYSLGGAIAAQIASKVTFDGLVLQSTFTNLGDMARVLYPKLPMHLISGQDFNTIETVRALQIPLVIIHGTDDEVIPHWMGQRLFESCESARELHVVNGGYHNDLYDRDAKGIVDAIARFALSLRGARAQEPVDSVEPPTPADKVLAAIRRSNLLRRYFWLRPSVRADRLTSEPL